MTIDEAFDIVTPINIARPEPQGVRPASCSAFEFEAPPEERDAAVSKGYALALHDLEAAACGLRLFLRGRSNSYAAHTDLKRARTALDEMLAALPADDREAVAS